MYLFPPVMFGVLFASFVVLMWALFFSPKAQEPKTISKKKTRKMVRNAAKANEIPSQFRRYNF